MSVRRSDLVVAGLGGIGSATAYRAAGQGLDVVGLEQFHALHDRGSSHGHSRIFRIAYFEAPEYVPLAQRSLEGWRRLETATGESLLRTTGGLDLGRPGGRLLEGALSACIAHGIAHERWDAATLRARAPGLTLPDDMEGVFQKDAAILNPTCATGVHLRAARETGAELRFGTRLLGWEREGEGLRLRVEGPEGETDIVTHRLILTAGAWLGSFAGFARALPRIAVERQVVGWLPALPSTLAGHTFPVVNAGLDEGHVYLMPAHDGRGAKIGLYHHRGERVENPDLPDPHPDATDRRLLQTIADRYLHGRETIVQMRTCRFTLTPDEHFIVDALEGERVVVGGGFSGHGFKFAPAIAEILVALARGHSPSTSLDLFRLDRFVPTHTPE
ncbi:MAG: N-methyl-L-tryptophan oxidase [Longimicrobiales bacterium]|nr:N-methyl-L-tryptophan oxidase [Longimicrobiales bacterium]